MLLPTFAGGGAERIFFDLAAGFRDRGIRTELLVGRPDGALSDQVPEGVDVRSLGAQRISAGLPGLVGRLRSDPPRALLSAMSHVNVVACMASWVSRSPTRVVLTEHQHLSTMLRHDANSRDRLLPLAMRLLYRRAAAVIAVSQGVADDLRARGGLSDDLLRVIYNPVDFDRIRALAAQPQSHPWLDGSGATRLLVAAGRLREQKDFPTLIRAMAELSDVPDLRLLILGEGPQRAELSELIVALGLSERVALAGFVANPYPYFRAADVLVMSSRWEGLPTVLLEALALGTRVVSTDCPSGPREILRGGRLGVLVAPGRPAELAAGIRRALASAPVETLDERPFKPEVVVGEYLELLLGNGG